MSKQLDIMGRAAQVHLHELDICKDKTKSYARRRTEATENLRRTLTPVWAALEKGQTVNGCKGKEMWARWFNPGAKGTNAMRQIQRIIVGKKEATSGRPKGFLGRIADAKKKLADIQVKLNDFTKGAVDSKPLYAQITPAIQPVFEEFLRLLSPDGYDVQLGDRGGWFVQEKWTAEQIAEAKEKEKPATKIVGTKLSTKRGGGDATVAPAPMTSKPHKTHQLQPNGRTWCGKILGDTLAKNAKMSDDPTCKQCQTGKMNEELRKKYGEDLKKKTKLTADETRFQIERLLSDYKTTDEDKFTSVAWVGRYEKHFTGEISNHPEWRQQQVKQQIERIERMKHARRTLKKEEPKPTKPMSALNQARHDEAVQRRKDYDEFLKTVPTGTTKKQEKKLWIVYLQRKHGYDLDPDTMIATPIKEHPAAKALAAAVDGAVIVKEECKQ